MIKKKRFILILTIALVALVVMFVKLKEHPLFGADKRVVPEMPTLEYTRTDIENLALLCKVWGFMKYYHPAVRAGEYDWDKELLCVMPSLISIDSKDRRNAVLAAWVDGFHARMKPGKGIAYAPDSIKQYPDIGWIEDMDALGTVLSGRLKEIRDAEKDTVCYYVTLMESGNAKFEHEQMYRQCKFPNISYQLLSLFRLWNAIQYFYPYKYVLKKSWNETLLEHIPLFLQINNRVDYENALRRFIAEVQDAHCSIQNRKMKEYVLPVGIRFIEGKAVVTGYYELKSTCKDSIDCILQPGDVILSVNSEAVDSLVKRMTPYISASNEATLLRDIATEELLWSSDSILYLDYERKSKIEKRKIQCLHKRVVTLGMHQLSKPLITKLPGDILYLYLGSLLGGKVPSKIEEKGLIIDLRAYPTQKMIEGYWDYGLLYPYPIDFVMPTRPSLAYPGLFVFGSVISVGKENEHYYKGKKVILVNELTQSQAEFMTMKYRCSPHTIVMGSMTAGTDGNLSMIVLPGGLCATFTGLGVYYPDRRETQQIGIVPDMRVENTIQGIREGRDEVLEAAIRYLND